jgi:hypothetical protein
VSGNPNDERDWAEPSATSTDERQVSLFDLPPIALAAPDETGAPEQATGDGDEVGPPVPTDGRSQLGLFGDIEWWEPYWRGMPEFVQKDLEPAKTIYVHFESPADVAAFATLVGQRVGMATRSIWYPEAEIGRYANKRYVVATPEEA